MAAVNVDFVEIHNYGDQVAVAARVDVATTGDTWAHGLRSVRSLMCAPRTNLTNVEDNGSGSIVFTTGGAVANILITVIGYP